MQYVLKSFIETREISYAYEPYSGGDILSKGNRKLPWEFEIMPKNLFNDEIVKKEIENTSHLEVLLNNIYFVIKIIIKI